MVDVLSTREYSLSGLVSFDWQYCQVGLVKRFVPSNQRKGCDYDVGVAILSTSHNGVTVAFDFRRFRPSRAGMT
jgi:hypothetical protein